MQFYAWRKTIGRWREQWRIGRKHQGRARVAPSVEVRVYNTSQTLGFNRGCFQRVLGVLLVEYFRGSVVITYV